MIRKIVFMGSLALSTLTLVHANDVVVLESTFTGDREQPAVSFFIPWQDPSGPDSLFVPVRSQMFFGLNEADQKELNRLYTYFANLDETAPAAETSSD